MTSFEADREDVVPIDALDDAASRLHGSGDTGAQLRTDPPPAPRVACSVLTGAATTGEPTEATDPPPAASALPPPSSAQPVAPLTAGDISEDRLLDDRTSGPDSGWRRAVHWLTGGLVSPPPSKAELAERAEIATVKTPVRGSRVIAAVSTKGGVGKTTTTVNLGHTFAAHRGDRVVALDGNPDAGSLGYRIRNETPATADDLLRQLDDVSRYADIRAFTSQAASRLEVVAAPDDPRASTALGEADYRRLLGLLEAHYQLILVDCGTGILDDATRGIVDHADQLVVVTAPSVDAARATSFLLDWLETHGHADLVADAVAVINAAPSGRNSLVDLDEVEAHFAARCRTVVRIPWDRHLAAGATTGLDLLHDTTTAAYRRLAAAVAEGFTPTPRKGEHPW
ncbi:MinD/ParA family ATP-binding protein [Salsipaludibacter albus]|uniref:MinD/ParA family ATP-binding protein n=1 Tax=Salsipaludibacter albus TaxID=2849650 RepID=UPI001EE4BE27|nr:MinD/ParA family protein [Salsipaludibacter albus]MBY5161472.1 MinD/ParA family protein [Salsipaludibacter albus]